MSESVFRWATVFCPKCNARKRAKMSIVRLFGTQRCPKCGHEWIPPRKERTP
jgi:Zn ribbon nucleic-acid-binding protein